MIKLQDTIFTFHYVSIKSGSLELAVAVVLNLHSTMYLLNPLGEVAKFMQSLLFTFHYVSIKSASA